MLHCWFVSVYVLVGSIVNKSPSATHQLFPVCYDNYHANLRHCAWPSHKDEDDACIGMYH